MDNETKSIYTSALEIADKIDQHLIKQSITHETVKELLRMDLREAVITEDEEIDIHTFCGGVELFVPAHVNVLVKSRSFIGGVGNSTVHVPDKDAPCLHIVASNFFGGVDVKN